MVLLFKNMNFNFPRTSSYCITCQMYRRMMLPVLGNIHIQASNRSLVSTGVVRRHRDARRRQHFHYRRSVWHGRWRARSPQWCRAVPRCRWLQRPALETNLRGWSTPCVNTILCSAAHELARSLLCWISWIVKNTTIFSSLLISVYLFVLVLYIGNFL